MSDWWDFLAGKGALRKAAGTDTPKPAPPPDPSTGNYVQDQIKNQRPVQSGDPGQGGTPPVKKKQPRIGFPPEKQ